MDPYSGDTIGTLNGGVPGIEVALDSVCTQVEEKMKVASGSVMCYEERTKRCNIEVKRKQGHPKAAAKIA